MTTTFLHGVEVIEIQDGPRPISTVRSSVIGLIGTAPDSAVAATAKLATGRSASNNAINITALEPGKAGNKISLWLKDPKGNSKPLSVSVSGLVITVSLATNARGAMTSTAAQVIQAITAHARAGALVKAENTTGSTGAGVVMAFIKQTPLAGGKDEAFPLNTPVLIAGNRREADQLDTKGQGAGTLPAAIDDIFDQTGAMIVVIRVAEGANAAATKSHIIGGTAAGKYQGVHAFLGAEQAVHVVPRILVAPEFSQEQAVTAEMVGIAERLRSVIIADGPNTDDAAAIDYRKNFGSDRVFIVDPQVTVFDPTTNATVKRPASARVAGLMAKSDNERGFWWSPSNREINGITGTARPIDFALGDKNARANYLNEHEVATIIRKDGYRLWGNRSCSSDPIWAFLSVRRTADMINDSLLRAHLWAVDRNISRTYIEDVLEGVNAYLRHLRAIGAIINGRAWADPELNTPSEIQQGKVYIDFDFSANYPAEHITFRSRLVNDYLTEVLTPRNAA